MSGVRATATIAEGVGGWVIRAMPAGEAPVDVTFFRGVPTVIESWTHQDPFGPGTCVLSFPAVTLYDPVGASEELAFLARDTNFDIEWLGPLPPGYPQERWVWEGFSRSFAYSATGVQVTLKGALFQLDDFLAKPEYALQPIPYETAIRRQFLDKPSLRLQTMRFEWPGWWTTLYNPVEGARASFVPSGVMNYEKWSGLVTRDTGSWDPALTGYIQSLLANWYTEQGRFTMSLLPGRRPYVHHRTYVALDSQGVAPANVVVLSPLQPGVEVSLSEDWEMAANAFFGQTKGLSGEAYSGMRVIGDGLATEYDPLAALPEVHPIEGVDWDSGALEGNAALRLSRMRKESKLELQAGLQADEAIAVGQKHLANFSEPGFTGTITLRSDVMFNGAPLHRSLLLAGMTVHVPGFKGVASGVLLHVAEVAWNGIDGTMTLTVDSKYRDKLTVDEIALRGRDALSVPRMIIGGRYTPTLPDQLFPWNYREGSGYIPSAPNATARKLFENMPYDVEFPWTEWTTKRPPKDPAWASCYIPIGPKAANANDNWATSLRNSSGNLIGPSGRFGFPVRMAQAGTIRLLQLAAYDRDGNVLKVPFHFSIYYQPGTNVLSMPKIPAEFGGLAEAGFYPTGQRYPFFPQAWEQYRLDGTQFGTEIPVSVQTAGLIQGWGNQIVPAGYWPGTKLDDDEPTGLLVDEEPWTFDLVGPTTAINQYSKNDLSVFAGFCYVMIYCDAQLAQEVFFMGRMYRQEPGVTA